MFFVGLYFLQKVDEIGMILAHRFDALAEVEDLVDQDALEVWVEFFLEFFEKHVKAGVVALLFS